MKESDIMSALLRVRVGAIAAGLSCLLLGPVAAQQDSQSPGQPNSTQPRANTPNRAGQLDGVQAPQNGQAIPRRETRTANYRGEGATSAAQGQEVENYLANCLLNHNKAEIELSQFAEQQAQNPEVKKFAQQLVKDHTQMVQKLEQLAGASGTARKATAPSLDSAARTETERQPGDATRLPGSSGTGPQTPAAGATERNANDLNRNANEATARSAAGGNSALHQLAGIEQKINDRCNQALREELQQKSGAEFDECFLGAQIAGHMHMLAALEVIPQETQGELKQVADEARPAVQKHLEHAKQLMTQLKAGGQGAAAAERTSTPAPQQQ